MGQNESLRQSLFYKSSYFLKLEIKTVSNTDFFWAAVIRSVITTVINRS